MTLVTSQERADYNRALKQIEELKAKVTTLEAENERVLDANEELVKRLRDAQQALRAVNAPAVVNRSGTTRSLWLVGKLDAADIEKQYSVAGFELVEHEELGRSPRAGEVDPITPAYGRR